MGWICISNECEGHISSSGAWDGSGVAYFSISDEISILHDAFFNYLLHISPVTYMFMFIIIVLMLIISVILSIHSALREVAK